MREGKKSGSSSRTKRVLGNIIDLQAARSGADMTLVEARASVIDEVIAQPLKKSKASICASIARDSMLHTCRTTKRCWNYCHLER
jgi:hypothetical protein